MRKRRCKGESKQILQMSAWLLASIRMMVLCSHTVAIRWGSEQYLPRGFSAEVVFEFLLLLVSTKNTSDSFVD